MNQLDRTALFRELHRGPQILVIANAWDAASARVFEHAGIRAVGTTSAGIANSNGYPDGEFMPKAAMLAAVARIVASVDVPVTADMVAGYGDRIDDLVATARDVIAAGAVGMNLEDGSDVGGPHLVDALLQEDRIRAVRAAVDAMGVPAVINARTDAFWLKQGDEKKRLSDSIERANRYRAAGADCLFVPGVVDQASIRTLTREIDGPVNILAVANCPPVAELQALGVRRLSVGSGPMRATMMLARHIAQELIGAGTYTRFHRDTVPYAEANALFDVDR